MADMRYFTEIDGQAVRLAGITHIPNAEFAALFPGVKGRRADSFSRWVGWLEGERELRPLLRSIEYKRNPSLHKCDARCRHAKGHSCECSCGGANHGRGEN